MAAALFLGFFLILGLSVVGVAMRGGPRGVRVTLEVGRKRPLHAVEFAVAGAIALFGIAVPAIVLLGDQASAGPGGTKLTADNKQGREIFAEKCATCHTLKDAGTTGAVGPVLDELQPDAERVITALKGGIGAMPSYRGSLSDEQMRALARYVSKASGGAR